MRATSDFLVFSSRTIVLQRICDWVGRGFVHWTGGEVGLERAPRLVQKFKIAYGVDANRNIRARRKRAGLGNSVLILWRRSIDHRTLHWWLLATPGDHPAHTAEQLQDATIPNGRIVIDGFELIRVAPREGQRMQAIFKRPRSTRPVWTWRMTARKYDDWRDSVIQAVRERMPDRQINNLFRSLFASPGFSGVRSQVGKIAALYRAEWKRTRGIELMPLLPARLGYIRRIPNEGVWLSTIAMGTRKEVAA